jgi:uracil-DNA glycosylase family 4
MSEQREDFDEQFRLQAEQLGLDVDVISEGPLNASIAIVGEGPGEQEVRHGRPFIGGAGVLLWNSLRPYGLHRAGVYTTNVVKRQISLSARGNEKHAVHRDELNKWTGMVRWELAKLPNLRTVFVMGNYALEALCGKQGITKWRGSVLKIGKITYVITFNPAYAQRELKMEPVFLMDCKKLDLVVRNVFKEHKVDAIINPTFRNAIAFISDLKKAGKPVGLDVEHIRETYCYGLGNDATRAMCINFRDGRANRYTAGQEAELLIAIQNLCESNKIIVQNGGHEIYWCWTHDAIKIPTWFDTLLAHHVLYPQLPHNLAFLVSQYTTHPFYKDDGETWKEDGNIDDFWVYNCKDVALMVAAQQKMDRELKEAKLDAFFFDHVMRAQQHIPEATVHGMAVDTEIKEYLIKQIGEDVNKHLANFHRLVHEITGDPSYFPNPASPKQMQELYFDVLKLNGKGVSTDRKNREHIVNDSNTSPLSKEIITAVNAWSSESKFFGTFASAKLGEDNRMRCDWKQYGVSKAPGRLSSSQTIDGQGMNMQNQPQRARSMYIADPGMQLAYFDLKQAEAVIVAYRANIPKWKEQFDRMRTDPKYDTHRALAAEMFKVPYEQVPTKDWDEDLQPTIRYIAKRCRHGLNYRMERQTLADVTKLPFHEASRAFVLYHKSTPELGKWWKQEEITFRRDRVLYNAFGRRLKVIQRLDDDVMDSIIAFYPQSTIGDKVVQVWYQSESDDNWPFDARICLDVHDNLVAIAAPGKSIKTALAIMKKYAEQPIMVQDAWNNPAIPVYIQAELKQSYPTVFDSNTNAFIKDAKGLHRWSHMEDVHL